MFPFLLMYIRILYLDINSYVGPSSFVKPGDKQKAGMDCSLRFRNAFTIQMCAIAKFLLIF